MLFELSNVSYSRGGRRVLDGATVRLPVGSSCLFGPSGSGKSTLLRLLDRLIDPENGAVLYEGVDVREWDPLALRREVVLVPQLPALIEGTVADNVALGPRLGGHSFDSRSALELAGLDESFASRPAGQLSVGEQQRVMLARGLALEPRVLLLDEPTSALDAEATAAVEGTLTRLRQRTSISLVLVTHDIDQAERMAERIVCIDAGRVTREGPAGEIAAAERERRAGAESEGEGEEDDEGAKVAE